MTRPAGVAARLLETAGFRQHPPGRVHHARRVFFQVRRQRVRDAERTKAQWTSRLAEVTGQEGELRPVVEKLAGGSNPGLILQSARTHDAAALRGASMCGARADACPPICADAVPGNAAVTVPQHRSAAGRQGGLKQSVRSAPAENVAQFSFHKQSSWALLLRKVVVRGFAPRQTNLC